MRFRRSISILSGICALSLTLGRSNSGCEGTSVMSAGTPTAAHAGMPMQSERDGERQKPCQSSAIVCCQAMTSCGLSVQLSRTGSADNTLVSQNQLPLAPFQASLQRVATPEPPPPKA